MEKWRVFCLWGLACSVSCNVPFAQSNFSFSNPRVVDLMKGNYDPSQYPRKYHLYGLQYVQHFSENISADSLKSYLLGLNAFTNRNTINDLEDLPERGIRGARNWIARRVEAWSNLDGHGVVGSEFSFDFTVCGRLRHTQYLSVIPGLGPERDELIVAVAHLDSRCEGLCDTVCIAYGAEDNGSGVALLLELSRVFSSIALNRTVVILWTTGEEQGLAGARAFALWCRSNGIKIKAVFNNDIVGGIECGATSSPPSCPGPGQVDSMRVRIFSSGLTNSMPKMLARLSKLVYDSQAAPILPSHLKVDLMSAEDRTGRGGDHIPFREQGYSSVRFTSSYEHGDGNPNQPGYHDRQHSHRDVLGIDVDGDQVLDSFFVHFNYLRHNTLLNACSIVNLSESNISSSIDTIYVEPHAIWIELPPIGDSLQHVVAIRSFTSVGFDRIVFTKDRKIKFDVKSGIYYASVAVRHPSGWISMFGNERQVRALTENEDHSLTGSIVLFQNRPNPFDEVSYIPVFLGEGVQVRNAFIAIHDHAGRLIHHMEVVLQKGMNEILYPYASHAFKPGVYVYSLWVNNQKIDSKKLQLIY